MYLIPTLLHSQEKKTDIGSTRYVQEGAVKSHSVYQPQLILREEDLRSLR